MDGSSGNKTNETEQNFTQSSNTSYEDNHLSSKNSDHIHINEVYDYKIYQSNIVDDNDYEDDIVVLDNVNYNTIDVWKSLYEYDGHSIDFNKNIFCSYNSSYNSNKNVLFKGSTQIVELWNYLNI